MKRITIAAMIIVSALLMASCASAVSEQPAVDKQDQPIFAYVHDWAEPKVPEGTVRILAEQAEKAAVEQAEAEAVQEDEYYYEDYYEPTYYDNSDGFMQQGVRDGVDSDTETWYSSNRAYHYRTSEWTADDEGYYRDSDGYYVVASNDYPEGSVVTTSKGEAKVYDSGTDSGNIDMYVNW